MNRLALSILAIALAFLPAIAIEPQASFDRTLTVTGPVELDVATHEGSITVHAGAAGTVRIHAVVRPTSRSSPADLPGLLRQIENNPPIHQSGNTVRIGVVEDSSLKMLVSVDYEITAPAETRARMRSGSGSLTANGLRGPVDATTASGKITLSGIGSEARAHTASGAVALAGIAGAADASTGSGAIEIQQTAANPVKAHTGSGAVKVHLPPQSGFDVRARTGSGRLSVVPPLEGSAAPGRHEISGKLRGGGPLVEVSTGSGSVHIE